MAEYLVSKCGVTIGLVVESESMREIIESQLGDVVRRQETLSVETCLCVSSDSSGWILQDLKTSTTYRGALDGDLIYQLSDRLLYHLADRNKSAHCLHAAAVSKNGKAIVMPANSGEGKSSFTAWLVANGFEYLSDEVALINSASLVAGVPRPIQIKADGMNAIMSLVTQPSLLVKGKQTTSLRSDAITPQIECNDDRYLAAFVFPKFLKSQPFSWRKMSSGECCLKVMSNHINARNLVGFGFSEMANIIRKTPAYELNYGGFCTLPNDFASIIMAAIEDD